MQPITIIRFADDVQQMWLNHYNKAFFLKLHKSHFRRFPYNVSLKHINTVRLLLNLYPYTIITIHGWQQQNLSLHFILGINTELYRSHRTTVILSYINSWPTFCFSPHGLINQSQRTLFGNISFHRFAQKHFQQYTSLTGINKRKIMWAHAEMAKRSVTDCAIAVLVCTQLNLKVGDLHVRLDTYTHFCYCSLVTMAVLSLFTEDLTWPNFSS